MQFNEVYESLEHKPHRINVTDQQIEQVHDQITHAVKVVMDRDSLCAIEDMPKLW